MTVSVGRNTNTSALEVADAISIYFSERSSGDFKDKYITFSEHPRFVSFSKCKSLRDKISVALAHNEVASTNVEAVFDLILNTAIHNNTPQEEIPANILIISDMEFNHAVYGQVDASLFKNIEDRYAKAGYKLPRLVFWNVNSRTNTIPIYENSLGVALVLKRRYVEFYNRFTLSSEYKAIFKCTTNVQANLHRMYSGCWW